MLQLCNTGHNHASMLALSQLITIVRLRTWAPCLSIWCLLLWMLIGPHELRLGTSATPSAGDTLVGDIRDWPVLEDA